MLHPNDSPAIILAFPFSILFDIDLYTHHSSPGNPSPDAGDCYLNFQLDSVTPLLPPFIPPNFDPGNIPFPIALSDVLGKLTDIVGAQFPRPALSLRQIAGLVWSKYSRGTAVVVLKKPSEPLLTADRRLQAGPFVLLGGEQQEVVLPLMVPFRMVMCRELLESEPERAFSKQDQL
jgi:hypothetical protein